MVEANDYRDQQERLRQVLQPDETVLWQGRPDQRAYIWQNYPGFIFGLFFLGFVVFWNAMVWFHMPEDGPGLLFRLWGIPFLLVGLYITFGQLIQKSLEWPHVLYLVTNRRLVILSGRSGARQRSRFLDALTSIELRRGVLDRRGGKGSIAADAPNAAPRWGGCGWEVFRGYIGGLTFLAVDNAEEVLRIIHQAREQSRQHDR